VDAAATYLCPEEEQGRPGLGLPPHSGRLPADVVLVPMIYLLDLLTDRERLLQRFANTSS
jgi:hypothetical protein